MPKISDQQRQILQWLAQQGGPVQSKDMAEQTQIKPTSLRTQLDRLKENDFVQVSEDGWIITEAGGGALTTPEGGQTLADQGMTPKQIFSALGVKIGVPQARVDVISDIVWSQESEDLEWVWKALAKCAVSTDLATMWLEAWRAYLKKPIPADLEGVVRQNKEAGTKTASDTVKPGDATGRDYVIQDGVVIRVGDGIGDFTMKDAKEVLALMVQRERFASMQNQGAGMQQPSNAMAEIITALAPFIKPDADKSMVKELLETKLALFETKLAAANPGAGASRNPVMEMVDFFKSLKELGPVLGPLLGLPAAAPAAAAAAATSVTPINNAMGEMTGKDGVKYVLPLDQLLTIRRFDNEERREDEKHQNSQQLVGAAKSLLGKLAAAAGRAADE